MNNLPMASTATSPIEAQRPHRATTTQPLTPAMRATLDEARAADPRPEVVAMWNKIERLAGASDDPAGALTAYCELFTAKADKIQAEHRAEIDRIAAALGAEIIEFDPATNPAGLSAVTTHGWYTDDPAPYLVFPTGQKVYERLAAARVIAERLQVTA
jgi:hypothetical protein